MIYFISDTHFGHSNIIRYTHRPFCSVEEMDRTIIRNWNSRVKSSDTVFHLGDFCFAKSREAPHSFKNAFEYYKSRLNGNIVLIQGNHDANNHSKAIIESAVIKHAGKRIYLTHNPLFAKDNFEINFCGHVHDAWKFKRLNEKSAVINLSVEHWRYMPVEINEIFTDYIHWKRETNE